MELRDRAHRADLAGPGRGSLSSSRPPASPSRDSSARSASWQATCSSQCQAGLGWPTMSSWNLYGPCYGQSARWRYPEPRPGSHVTTARSKSCWKAPAQPPKSVRDVRDRAKPSGGRTAASLDAPEPQLTGLLRRILRPTDAHDWFAIIRSAQTPAGTAVPPEHPALPVVTHCRRRLLRCSRLRLRPGGCLRCARFAPGCTSGSHVRLIAGLAPGGVRHTTRLRVRQTARTRP
jgi:hypothetical protein